MKQVNAAKCNTSIWQLNAVKATAL